VEDFEGKDTSVADEPADAAESDEVTLRCNCGRLPEGLFGDLSVLGGI
jgi:hypothetical protein